MRRDSSELPGSDKTSAVNPRVKRESTPLDHLTQIITVYTTATRNPWLQIDTVTYLQHRVDQVPVEKVKTVIQMVFQRAESRVNSFVYFAKEILALYDPQNLGMKRRALATILRRVRE